MKTNADTALLKGHRFPRRIISHAVCLYHRFALSLRDVEDLLAERGIIVGTVKLLATRRTKGRWCMGCFSRGIRSLMSDLLGASLNADRIRPAGFQAAVENRAADGRRGPMITLYRPIPFSTSARRPYPVSACHRI
jgi:hypothetical protein